MLATLPHLSTSQHYASSSHYYWQKYEVSGLRHLTNMPNCSTHLDQFENVWAEVELRFRVRWWRSNWRSALQFNHYLFRPILLDFSPSSLQFSSGDVAREKDERNLFIHSFGKSPSPPHREIQGNVLPPTQIF